jgi:hypothetical protein
VAMKNFSFRIFEQLLEIGLRMKLNLPKWAYIIEIAVQ